MARTLNEAAISTRKARAKLAPGLHWRGIDVGVHLGYRKGRRGGTWLVRWRADAGYRQVPIGAADDHLKEGTLDFDSATRAARAAVEEARVEAAAVAAGPILTVASAVSDYIVQRNARASGRAGRPVRSDAAQRLGRYVTGQPARGREDEIAPASLASVELHKLAERDLLRWREALPNGMKATTRQRLINDLKAALNAAYAANRDRLDPNLPAAIKHGLRAIEHGEDTYPVARDNQILGDGQVARLIAAAREVDREQEWSGDLFRMVLVLAATGARFSQVARMRVSDCQISAGRLLVPVSRKGRGGKRGSIPVPVGRDVLEALVPITTGRPADAPMLERWRSRQAPGSIEWQRESRGAWQAATELLRPWRVIRARAGLPEVIPYALRHSSIVRGIRANLPLRLVAALHDTSTAMIERHYAKHIADGLEDMARAAIVPLAPQGGDARVVSFSKSGA